MSQTRAESRRILSDITLSGQSENEQNTGLVVPPPVCLWSGVDGRVEKVFHRPRRAVRVVVALRTHRQFRATIQPRRPHPIASKAGRFFLHAMKGNRSTHADNL